jgi:hypothetical protein
MAVQLARTVKAQDHLHTNLKLLTQFMDTLKSCPMYAIGNGVEKYMNIAEHVDKIMSETEQNIVPDHRSYVSYDHNVDPASKIPHHIAYGTHGDRGYDGLDAEHERDLSTQHSSSQHSYRDYDCGVERTPAKKDDDNEIPVTEELRRMSIASTKHLFNDGTPYTPNNRTPFGQDPSYYTAPDRVLANDTDHKSSATVSLHTAPVWATPTRG